MHLDHRGGLRQHRQVGSLLVSLHNACGCTVCWSWWWCLLINVFIQCLLYTVFHYYWIYVIIYICYYMQPLLLGDSAQIMALIISLIPWTTTPLWDIILVITPPRKNSPQASALSQITPLMVWFKISNYESIYPPNLSHHNNNIGLSIGMLCRLTTNGRRSPRPHNGDI